MDEAHPHGIIPVKTDPITGKDVVDSNGVLVYDYNKTIPVMLLTFFPTGVLGLGLTALLASFMSGMAGNVTAFNTVWTYDIYQAYINKNASDAHYLWMGRMATIGGIVLSIGAAYAVTSFNNIMDALQLVFALVNAPLFATFLLGMFSKRTTGHGAFTGLVAGTAGALVHHGLTLPLGDTAGIHGGWIAHPPPLSQRHGAELLDRHLRVQHQPGWSPSWSRACPPRAPSRSWPGWSTRSPPSPSKPTRPGTRGRPSGPLAVLALAVVLNIIFA